MILFDAYFSYEWFNHQLVGHVGHTVDGLEIPNNHRLDVFETL